MFGIRRIGASIFILGFLSACATVPQATSASSLRVAADQHWQDVYKTDVMSSVANWRSELGGGAPGAAQQAANHAQRVQRFWAVIGIVSGVGAAAAVGSTALARSLAAALSGASTAVVSDYSGDYQNCQGVTQALAQVDNFDTTWATSFTTATDAEKATTIQNYLTAKNQLISTINGVLVGCPELND